MGIHIERQERQLYNSLGEIKQLGSDLKIDDIKLREMISESFGLMGVSESWLRKLLPESLKSTKHTRKDYLELQQKRNQQITTTAATAKRTGTIFNIKAFCVSTTTIRWKNNCTASHDNKAVAIAPQTQNKEIGLSEELDKHKATIEKLKQRIDELEKENRHLRETAGQHQDQQQQQEERFTAHRILQIKNNDVPVKVTVNVKTKTIEYMVMTLHESIVKA